MSRVLNILLLLAANVHLTYAIGYAPRQNGVDAQWIQDDMCGIFTTSNTEIVHWVMNNASNLGTLSAYGWSLTPNAQYYAYYPFSESYTIDRRSMTALPVSYMGQSQTRNNNTDHLSSYDYMTAQSVSTADACHFSFSHLGCMLRIECALQGAQTLYSLNLSSQGRILPTSGTMDVTTGTLTPDTYSETVILSLNGMRIEEDEHLVAYLMLPPMDLTGIKLNVSITTTDGQVSMASITGTKIISGCFYPMELQMPPFAGNGDAHTASANARGLLIKHTPEIMAAAIDSPTAYVPGFILDTDHAFVQSKQEDTPTAVQHQHSVTSSEQLYLLNGIRALYPKKGTIYINKGKKFIGHKE